MSDGHTELGHWAAAYLLGALDSDDRRRFEQHRASCARCQAELAELAPLPSLLGRLASGGLDPGRQGDPAAPSAAVADAVAAAAVAEQRTLRRSRRRWRLAAGAGTAAAAVLAALLGVEVLDQGPPARPVVAADIVESHVTTARLTTSRRGWGTEVALEATGLPNRPVYHLWAVDADGTWIPVAAWGPTQSGATRLTGATALATTEVGYLVVTSDDRDDVLIRAAVDQLA